MFGDLAAGLTSEETDRFAAASQKFIVIMCARAVTYAATTTTPMSEADKTFVALGAASLWAEVHELMARLDIDRFGPMLVKLAEWAEAQP